MRKASLDVIAIIFSESGCDWAKEEYSVHMQTIGFFDLQFVDDFSEAVEQWVSDMEGKLQNDCYYRLMMRHVHEYDAGVSCHSRYFEIFDESIQRW